MKKFSFIILFLAFLAAPVNADVYEHPAKLSGLSKQLPEIHSIKCSFKQEKSLPSINKPLISGGEFEFIEGEGVYFNTNYPIKSAVNYTNKNYKQINDIIKAISAKKYSKLEKEFEFFYTGQKTNWILGMKPKKESGAYNYISSITLEGTDYINKIRISQTNGNSTVIWFKK